MKMLRNSFICLAFLLATGSTGWAQSARKSAGSSRMAIPAASPMGTLESYANGQVKGYWKFNRFNDNETGTYGHKTVHSAYDPVANKVYILSDVRNVLSGQLADSASLEMTNQKVIINGNLFLGVNTPTGGFHLIAAIHPEWNTGSIHYSQDGGFTWQRSTGGDLANRDVRWSAILEDPTHTVLVLTLETVSKASGKIDIYSILESTDQGLSFHVIKSWQENEPGKMLACKPYNSNSCYFISKLNQSNVWQIREFDRERKDFRFISRHYSAKVPGSFVGTKIGDTTHLFAGAAGGGFSSVDDGMTWKEGSIRERIAAVDPENANLLIESSATTWISKDAGKKWELLPWWEPVFGWDMQGLQWFRNREAKWFAILNNDFGAHFTEKFTDSLSWKHLNTDNIHMILHHGDYDEQTDLLLTANQDRGTMLWERAGDGKYQGTTVTKADGLRVTIAGQGNSYWYIHYWNTVYRKEYQKGRREKLDSLVCDIPRALKDTTWYTPPMQPSWKPGQDAVFLAGNGRLIRLSYDPYYNSIARMELPFNFRDTTDEVLAGLATTRADDNRMYAATKNGRFFSSADLGKSWTPTTYSGPVPFVRNRPWWGPYGYSIQTAPDDPDFVCWAGDGDALNAFLISEDGGKNFIPASDGLPAGTTIRDIAVTQGGALVFANNGYVFSLADRKWYDMSGGSCPNGGTINRVIYLPRQKIVRYFTYGVGVLDFVLTK